MVSFLRVKFGALMGEVNRKRKADTCLFNSVCSVPQEEVRCWEYGDEHNIVHILRFSWSYVRYRHDKLEKKQDSS